MGFVPVIRSFNDSLWAVLAELESPQKGAPSMGGQRPSGAGRLRRFGSEPVTHTVRVAESLKWLRAFLKRFIGDGLLGRRIDIREWMSGPQVRITTDASPWGIGAVLEVESVPRAYLSDAISQKDAQRLHFELGSCKGQAAAEALAVLVALRAWAGVWISRRTAVHVKSDSEAALGALGKLSSPAPAVNCIAKEVALDIALSSYGVDVWSHISGEENKEADTLSRWYEPQAPQEMPAGLAGIERTVPPRSR